MNKGRMEASGDGVLAVIITIMVLEMKSPRGPTLAALGPVLPVLLSPAEFRLHRHLLEQPSPRRWAESFGILVDDKIIKLSEE